MEIIKLIINTAKAQELIPCRDGTMADPDIGCVAIPDAILNPESELLEIIFKLGSFLSSAITAIAIIGIIYGSIHYIVAMGNDEKISKAKHIIFWSIAGLILGLTAHLITELILNIVS